MNCQSFGNLVSDLARGVPLEARAQTDARAHEAGCARCAARLADERALSGGLSRLAESTREAAAPARVEANLLAAFRARAASTTASLPTAPETHAAAVPPPAADVNVLPFARPSAPRRWTWVKTAAGSAAAAAAAVALFVLVAPQRSAPPQVAQAPEAPATRAALTPPDMPGAFPAAASAAGAETRNAGESNAPLIPRAVHVPRVTPARAGGRLTTTPVSYRKDAGRAARLARGAGAAGAEIATSFIPLTHDAALAAADGGQVVRVELPRSALQRFGLPMNFERAGERVKADVLLGHDGVARAIRFVR